LFLLPKVFYFNERERERGRESEGGRERERIESKSSKKKKEQQLNHLCRVETPFYSVITFRIICRFSTSDHDMLFAY
jgi:hypothetical protein